MPIQYTTTQWEIAKVLKWREKGKLRVPRHQRGSAWNREHENALIDTIYRGLPISSITLSSVDLSGNNVHFIEDGCQRIRTLEKFRNNLIDYQGSHFTSLPPEIQEEFLRYKIPVLIYSGATEEERIEIFDRLQNGILLSYGERFHSMRFLSPLVDLSCRTILNEDSPFYEKISKVWGTKLLTEEDGRKRGDGTKRYRNLREAVCLMAGCLWGPEFYSENYNELREKLRKTVTKDQETLATKLLGTILKIYEMAMDAETANDEIALKDKKLKDAFWAPKNFSGYILYSLWYNRENVKPIVDLWVAFLVQYRTKPSLLKDRIHTISKGCTREEKYKIGWLSVSDSERKIVRPRNTVEDSDEEEDEEC